MANQVVRVTTLKKMVEILKAAKLGGQFVTLYAEVGIKLNKYPTDGSEKIHISELGFNPTNRYHVNYQFGIDYERAMSKALGEDYTKGGNDNIETLIPNLLMRYKSTNNPCIIYINGTNYADGKFNNGLPYTEKDEQTEKRYTSKASKTYAPVEYRTVSVRNVTRITANHTTYEIAITDFDYEPEPEHAPAYAVAAAY